MHLVGCDVNQLQKRSVSINGMKDTHKSMENHNQNEELYSCCDNLERSVSNRSDAVGTIYSRARSLAVPRKPTEIETLLAAKT